MSHLNPATHRPEIVALCGSTRHPDAWQKAFYTLQMAGIICLTAAFPPAGGDTVVMDAEQKAVLDGLWRHHIDLADKALVLNVGGYIGDSTWSEIDYAFEHGKPVHFLHPDQGRAALLDRHEYDELIFGGFICVHCTPDDCDDPDDNVYWPCPPLRTVGVTDEEAIQIITAHRAEVERKAAQEAGAL